MRWLSLSLVTVLFCGVSLQAADPPPKVPLSDEVREELTQAVVGLRAEVAALATNEDYRQRLVDIEIAIDAVDRSMRFDELDKKDSPAYAREVLALARERINRLKAGGDIDWDQSPQRTVLGYRSKIDDTVQPYAISLPDHYLRSRGLKWYPLYVELHGRGDQSEVPFIRRHLNKPVPEDQTWIQLDVFGRGNNAYRYAGETDVFEAIADVMRRYRIDEQRIVLWGFSMGGAGAWHLGLHHPTKWCAVGAGAGFVDFYKYQKIETELPEFQHRPLRIYDSTNYVLNLADVPFVTYGGENDPQLLASTTMRDLAQPLGLPLQVIIGPQMGHKFDDASKKAFMDFLATHAERGLPPIEQRRQIRFVTSTVKFNECAWLRVEEQTTPYSESRVESETLTDGTLHLKTHNVLAMSISPDITGEISIDSDHKLTLTKGDGKASDRHYLVRRSKFWKLLSNDEKAAFFDPSKLRKRHDLQGPIDDAFTGSFLCVRGTGQPWSTSHQAYTDWNLKRFQSEFDQWMRGQVRTVDDSALTPEQIENNHLVLFGDPGSNGVLARIIKKLPLNWTRDAMTFAGTSYNPDLHCVCLIFPNPLNPRKYVVLNSGHTFHEENFTASNAWLFPKLGDAGVIRFRPREKDTFGEEIVTGEIFDTAWQLSK